MISSGIIKNCTALTAIISCLTVAAPSFAEKVTEPVPNSPHMDLDLVQKVKSGKLTDDITVRRFNNYIQSPGDFTKNKDIPEYDVLVAGQSHFQKIFEDMGNPNITNWDTQLKLPKGCRWIQNPPELAPIIVSKAKVNGPTKTGSWKVISCAMKVSGKDFATGTKQLTKSWTLFYHLYMSFTSAPPAAVLSLVQKNLVHLGYEDVNASKGISPICGNDPKSICNEFFNKHTNISLIAGEDNSPTEAKKLTTYPPALEQLKEYFRHSNKLTFITIHEVSLEPLDAPLKPIGGTDGAFAPPAHK